ncbi:hypothetical protein ACP275_01G005700 [Erythranthe tilingii]
MNFSAKGGSSAAKASLNPNAVEFVPSAIRSQSAAITISDTSSKLASKSILDRSESSISNNSDEEAQQYWSNQLPDDITPDFNEGLSLADVNEEGSRYTMLNEKQGLLPYSLNGNGHTEKMRYPVSSYGNYPAPNTGFQPSLGKLDKQVMINDHVLARQDHPYNRNSRNGFLAEISNEQLLVENADVGPLEFLASRFPGFADQSLVKAYFSSGGDLNLTIERLSRLELQADRALNPTLNSKALDFPALSRADLPKFSDDNHRNISPYHSAETDNSTFVFRPSSIPSRRAADYASAVRKMASQDSSIWKYERNGSSDTNVGSSTSSLLLESSYSGGPQRAVYGNHESPVWLETGGEAVANVYSEMREGARDRARVRNVYFEQARQAYLTGNNALAKELIFKGQLLNVQMKSAHGKAQESIYRPRNPEIQANWRERMIDLHGLHTSEAIYVLKGELAVLKNAARSADQRLVAYIYVGTGQHMRGPRTPTRLSGAVQHYLLEEERLDYTEPQAGLLRVVIY